jgi:hypothetical protein
MKTKNFPAKKLRRQLVAAGEDPAAHQEELNRARAKRTKKYRGVKYK